jgi:hypothetical protein
MKVTTVQKISLAFFACTLLPAYHVANWRYEVSFSVLSEKIEREDELLQSTQKLLSNCEQNESKSNDHYDANHQVCTNGERAHERTTLNIDTLTHDREQLHSRWWRNFFLVLISLNVIGILVYKSRQLLLDGKSL